MTRLTLAAGIATILLGVGPALAQQSGGIVPGGGGGGAMLDPSMMAGMGAGQAILTGPPPTRTPVPVAAVNPARARQGANQAAIAKIRGDAGFLAGFQQGVPLAASRQPAPPPIEFPPPVVFIDASATFNNFQSVVNLELLQQGGTEGEPPVEAQGPEAGPQVPGAPAKGGVPPQRGGGRPNVQINNTDGVVAIDSFVNAAIGTGNVAQQVINSRR